MWCARDGGGARSLKWKSWLLHLHQPPYFSPSLSAPALSASHHHIRPIITHRRVLSHCCPTTRSSPRSREKELRTRVSEERDRFSTQAEFHALAPSPSARAHGPIAVETCPVSRAARASPGRRARAHRARQEGRATTRGLCVLLLLSPDTRAPSPHASRVVKQHPPQQQQQQHQAWPPSRTRPRSASA